MRAFYLYTFEEPSECIHATELLEFGLIRFDEFCYRPNELLRGRLHFLIRSRRVLQLGKNNLDLALDA